MDRKTIALEEFSFDATIIHRQWLLLTAGEFSPGKYNTMTISWGSAGTIWNKPFFQVVVRESRYTRKFMESSEFFTLSAFSEDHRPALSLLGAKSGRDGDKIKLSGLTPIPSKLAPAPGFAEAELIVECRKMYWHDIDPTHFLDSSIQGSYPKGDYHRAYFGEIVAVSGTNKYRR